MLPDKHRAELDNQLNELHQSLVSASSKLNELHEPSIEISSSGLYKQPGVNLLSYRVVCAPATSNVLDVLESLQLVINKTKSENAQLAVHISVNSNLASTDGN